MNLEVVQVRLPVLSWASQRYSKQPHRSRYSVIVDLSRPLERFEIAALNQLRALVKPLPDKFAVGVIVDTTLEFVENSLFRINRELSDAVTLGARLQAAASAADQQMATTMHRINTRLGAGHLVREPRELAAGAGAATPSVLAEGLRTALEQSTDAAK
ncbi:MAG: hypothetical protein SW019_22825 [Actinomycetota bacterium]|nr:hypothetical protein [Actinomycetota bacterium]